MKSMKEDQLTALNTRQPNESIHFVVMHRMNSVKINWVIQQTQELSFILYEETSCRMNDNNNNYYQC